MSVSLLRCMGGSFAVFSTFGKNSLAIGLLSTRSLRSDMWKDEGCIVCSHDWKKDSDGQMTGDNWNAIDPSFVIDDNDMPWLEWGSFCGDLQYRRISRHWFPNLGVDRSSYIHNGKKIVVK